VPILRRVISSALLVAALSTGIARAHQPTVADLDAESRSAGNKKEIAMAIGEAIFKTDWPAQVFRVSANGIDGHIVVGLGVYGVKFHDPMTRAEFATQVSELAQRAFTAAPEAEEVDIWAVVPISVGKGVIVTGDLAKPTTRTVFTATVRRNAPEDLLPTHLLEGPKTYWDEEWARTAFKQGT
jgi:hypothetical protein